MNPKRIGAIVSAYTGFLCGNFSAMQEYADELFGYPTFTHMYGDKMFVAELKKKATPDFLELAKWCSKNEI